MLRAFLHVPESQFFPGLASLYFASASTTYLITYRNSHDSRVDINFKNLMFRDDFFCNLKLSSLWVAGMRVWLMRQWHVPCSVYVFEKYYLRPEQKTEALMAEPGKSIWSGSCLVARRHWSGTKSVTGCILRSKIKLRPTKFIILCRDSMRMKYTFLKWWIWREATGDMREVTKKWNKLQQCINGVLDLWSNARTWCTFIRYVA